MSESVPVSVKLRVEAICTRFEVDWQAAAPDGVPPRFEGYLGEATGPERQALLAALLRLDVHYRRGREENVAAADYETRFPDNGPLIREILAEAGIAESSRSARPDTDRNLLFAVLALQAGLIDRDRFIQACTLWATHKDVPIADLLVEQGWLAPTARSLVEQLLQLQMAKHADDAAASLAAAAGAEARSALASVADAGVEQSLTSISGRADPPAAADDPFSTVLPTEEAAGRNLLYEEIGRGGMGRVLRGCDPALRRDLAVKVLHEEYRDNTELEQRFVEEAQIGGQLQHPGVVPVYELGRFADRRPFFTMKLVKGRTLAQLLKERSDLRHDLPRFLTIFEQVCQTLAYAHSKGVIHRDLKPGNIMVGAFGEVQVMDWGLAKVLPRPQRAAAATGETSVLTARDYGSAEDGRTGVIGTPAFMPPEQARSEAVDERADVFGLGGLLCVLLTGKPPFVGATRKEVMQKAAAGDVAESFARLEGCGADAELVALCKECLGPEAGQRPREGGEVAARMAGYQAGVQQRLRQAELERAAAEVRAEEEARTRRVAEAKAAVERRARRLTVGLAAAVLALLLVGAGGGFVVQHQAAERRADQARRETEQSQTVEFALEKASVLRQQARWGEAAVVLEQARQVLGDGGSAGDLLRRLDVAEAELALVNRLDTIRLRRSNVGAGSKFDNQTAESDYAKAFQEARLGALVLL
ncbi:MAG TPA: serine/threonine-protein kinase [Gemmataceae bacterium]|nr:serine/threonine-protein kinase [Gemmataceae bacterium]